MNRRYLVFIATAACWGIALRSSAGCSSSPDGTTAARDSGRDGAVASSDSAIDAPRIAVVSTTAWALYNDYDPTCGFYLPTTPAAFPPVIEWQPCASTAVPAGISCRQMVEDWYAWPDGPSISPSLPATVSSGGAVTFMLSRFVAGDLTGDGLGGYKIYRMIADADGPVHSAILETSGTCTLGTDDVREGKYVHRVFDSASGTLSDFGGGLLAGDVDNSVPELAVHYNDGKAQVDRTFLASAPSYLELAVGSIVERSWADAGFLQNIWLSTDDPGLQAGAITRRGGTTLWGVSSSSVAKIKINTNGVSKELIAFDDNVTSQGAGDLGTDGIDMVWTEGSGGFVPPGIYANVSIMTAPYAEDPTAIVKRRLLATTGYGLSVLPFVVGCGYAARSSTQMIGDGGIAGGVLVVRLSDGSAWLLPSDNTMPQWQWQTPLAVTCDEVFVLVATNPDDGGAGNLTIGRVRLDSLGSPLPPS